MAAARNVSAAPIQTLRPALDELCGQFADGRGLAGAVHPDNHYHVGFALAGVEPEVRVRAVGLLKQRGDLLAQDALQFGGIHVLVAGNALLDAADDLHGGLHADVRGDEHLLQVVEHVGIDRRASGHGARQLREETALGLLQSGVQLLLLLPELLLGGGRLLLFLAENIEKCHVWNFYAFIIATKIRRMFGKALSLLHNPYQRR